MDNSNNRLKSYTREVKHVKILEDDNSDNRRNDSRERDKNCRKSCCMSDAESDIDPLNEETDEMETNKLVVATDTPPTFTEFPQTMTDSNTSNPESDSKMAAENRAKTRPTCLPDLVRNSRLPENPVEYDQSDLIGQQDHATRSCKMIGRRDSSGKSNDLKSHVGFDSRTSPDSAEEEVLHDENDFERANICGSGVPSSLPRRAVKREMRGESKEREEENVSQGQKFLIGRHAEAASKSL